MLTRRTPISVADAQEKINAIPLKTETEVVALTSANHRILAEDVHAPYDYPHFRRAGMDGYAILASDDHDYPREFTVRGEIQAGATWDTPLHSGDAVRIMTGAYVPEDAGKVIRIEKTRPADDQTKVQIITTEEKSNITEAGTDVKNGDIILPKNQELNPGGLAVLTAFGVQAVKVYKKPRIAIIATGTELLAANDQIEPGKIFNSNGIMLKNLVEETGGVVDFETQLPDDAALIKQTLEEQMATHEIVITDGGVSVGDFDYIGDEARKADQLLFNKIKQRPGSVTTAFVQNNTLVMALSGNPGACFTGFYLYMEPLIRRYQHQSSRIKHVRAILAAPYNKTNGFDRYLRCTYEFKNNQFYVYPNGINRSGSLANLQTTTCLALIPHSTTPMKVGTETDAWLLPFK
ncbi:molybdopterin molybdotransferase MoeA [Limosilactobacillus sp. RRLNB_1_1]|uniref:Molybdopterin molybdenumtransferase n=1 Tax=Limosilactobacillus albertensis TaxID=2759752 RepID=A0A7W3TQR7_9LACO|nr:molybdopterin molybdotransferase MoeA [Limosilactobacillus albertensis]MBB1069182.1 molybdopterin molybdotransferase MoeA [Limosilactobacillus albertensis]MCD7117575.1 molybdopterin molybdotransferase MoeA [Limosilactobacillus albertensis]MCD7128323.1 molybdopterin molybdotransferase MoeA [Limosilactobacillus albertensis]